MVVTEAFNDRFNHPEGIKCAFKRSPIDLKIYLVFEHSGDADFVANHTPLAYPQYSYGQYENAVLFESPDDIIGE